MFLETNIRKFLFLLPTRINLYLILNSQMRWKGKLLELSEISYVKRSHINFFGCKKIKFFPKSK